MTTRITNADLDAAFNRVTRAAAAIGMDTTNWRMGQLTGSTFRLMERDPDTGGLASTPFDSYLGTTKAEAFRALNFIASTVWGVLHFRDETDL